MSYLRRNNVQLEVKSKDLDFTFTDRSLEGRFGHGSLVALARRCLAVAGLFVVAMGSGVALPIPIALAMTMLTVSVAKSGVVAGCNRSDVDCIDLTETDFG